MRKDDFHKAIRSPGGKFRVEDITITTDAGELRGKGFMEVIPGDFKLSVILSAESGRIPIPEGYRTSRQFWPLTGIIEDEIRFKLRALPSGSSFHSGMGVSPRSILEFSANRMELVPMGFDCMTSGEIYQMQEAAKQQAGIGQSAPTPTPSAQNPAPNTQVTFKAVLRDYNLIEHNGSTETITKNPFLSENSRFRFDTFHGNLPEWEYGLIERNGDLEIYLKSKPDYVSQGADHDTRLWNAFLQAIAFTQGKHAWPFFFEHRRNGKLVADILLLNEDVASSRHTPFSKYLAFSNATKKLVWKYEEALELAYKFFANDTKLMHEIENLLYIYREASNRGIAKRISLLSLCSLFESITRVIYEERIAPAKAAEVTSFEQARDEVFKELSKKPEPVYRRLAGIVKAAEPVNNRTRYEAVIQHLNLKPEQQWLDLYTLWQKSRNPVSHRMSGGAESEDSIKEELYAESRIAGAINCFILKLMGYSGYVRMSTYEDKYGQI